MRQGRFGGLPILLVVTCILLVQADYSGDCYDKYGITARTCSELSSSCTFTSCKSENGDMQYECTDPSCSGWYKASTGSSSTSASNSDGSSITDGASACEAISLSTCDEAKTKFNGIGCSCFTCTETNGNIVASCSSPFTCSPPIATPQNKTSDAPEMSSEDYGIVCAVFIATAIVLAGGAAAVAFFCFPEKNKAEPSNKELIAKRMSCITWLLYRGSLKSFVQDDGLPTGFIDYICDKKELVGFLDCRKKTAVVRPRWMRLSAIVTSLMVTISLAILMGTVVYNNENCVSTRTVNDCCDCKTLCGGIEIGCDGCSCKSCSSGFRQCLISQITLDDATTTSNSFTCQSASVDTSNMAYWITTGLTIVMGIAGSYATRTATDGSLRQKLLHVVTASASIALIVFGVLYSQHVVKKSDANDNEKDANERRIKAIGITLVAGWGYEQLVGYGAIFGQYVVCRVCYYWWYRPQLEKIKNAGAATVHPHGGHGLDNNIMKTDGIKVADASKPVAVEEVKLQPPTQQQ